MKNTIQTKRNKPSSSGMRTLHAKTTGKRKLRATTTMDPNADLDADVPNVGVGRALLVILFLHVIAIAAIYIHSSFFSQEDNTAVTDTPKEVPNKPAATVKKAPVKAAPLAAIPVIEDETDNKRHIVEVGETYELIAKNKSVDEQALRALNNDKRLMPGVVLDLPAQLSSRPIDVTPAPPVGTIEKPVALVVEEEEESGFNVADAPKAVLVKPTIEKEPATVGDSGVRYTIKSGDTLWRISNKFKVSRESLLELNNIKDPNKLYAGREIKIPTKQR